MNNRVSFFSELWKLIFNIKIKKWQKLTLNFEISLRRFDGCFCIFGDCEFWTRHKLQSKITTLWQNSLELKITNKKLWKFAKKYFLGFFKNRKIKKSSSFVLAGENVLRFWHNNYNLTDRLFSLVNAYTVFF